MSEDTKKIIFLGIHDSKYGNDVSAHTTYDGAVAALAAIARQALPSWCELIGGADFDTYEYDVLTDEKLLNEWGEITGYNEFFTINPVPLEGYNK